MLFSLPKIQTETSKHLELCREQLNALPKKIAMEPMSYVLTLITCLSDRVQKFVHGTSDSNCLIHQNRDAYALFKSAIGRTTPNFMPYPSATIRGAMPLRSPADDCEDAEGCISDMKPVYLNDMRKHIEM